MKEYDYENLRQKLDDNEEWPRVYFFKFIIPSDNQKLALVEALFGNEAEVRIKQSNKGNYLSISAKELMLDSESVIARYKKAREIDGLIAL